MGGKRKCFQRPIITFILRFPFSPQYKCHLIAVVCGVVLTLLLKKILSKCNWVKLQFERNQLEMSMNTISQSFVLFKNLCLKKKQERIIYQQGIPCVLENHYSAIRDC